MNPKPAFEIHYSPDSADDAQARAKRYAANRLNAAHSTGPRTDAGKARSALNSISHGLTAQSPLLPSEDLAAFERHRQAILDEYRPQGPTESQLVDELADTSWRLKRIPALEASLFRLQAALPAGSVNVDVPDLETCLAVTEALRRQERMLNALSAHGNRLHRQYHKTLDHLRYIQADRKKTEQRTIQQACGVLEMYKRKGLPFDPAEHGFVLSATIYLTDHTVGQSSK